MRSTVACVLLALVVVVLCKPAPGLPEPTLCNDLGCRIASASFVFKGFAIERVGVKIGGTRVESYEVRIGNIFHEDGNLPQHILKTDRIIISSHQFNVDFDNPRVPYLFVVNFVDLTDAPGLILHECDSVTDFVSTDNKIKKALRSGDLASLCDFPINCATVLCPEPPCPIHLWETLPGECCPTCTNNACTPGEIVDVGDPCFDCRCAPDGEVLCFHACEPQFCQPGFVEVDVPGECCTVCVDEGEICEPGSEVDVGDECVTCRCDDSGLGIFCEPVCDAEICGPGFVSVDVEGECCSKCVLDCSLVDCMDCPNGGILHEGDCCETCNEGICEPGSEVDVGDECVTCRCDDSGLGIFCEPVCEAEICAPGFVSVLVDGACCSTCVPDCSGIECDNCPAGVIFEEGDCCLQCVEILCEPGSEVESEDPCMTCTCDPTGQGKFCLPSCAPQFCPFGEELLPGDCCPTCLPEPLCIPGEVVDRDVGVICICASNGVNVECFFLPCDEPCDDGTCCNDPIVNEPCEPGQAVDTADPCVRCVCSEDGSVQCLPFCEQKFCPFGEAILPGDCCTTCLPDCTNSECPVVDCEFGFAVNPAECCPVCNEPLCTEGPVESGDDCLECLCVGGVEVVCTAVC